MHLHLSFGERFLTTVDIKMFSSYPPCTSKIWCKDWRLGLKRRLQTRQRIVYCHAHSHIRNMVGCAEAEKSAPVPFPSYANPERLTASLFGVKGGDSPNRKGISHEHSNRYLYRSTEVFFSKMAVCSPLPKLTCWIFRRNSHQRIFSPLFKRSK